MGVKKQIQSMISNNPLARARRKHMRNSLRNTEFTLLAPNCMAGILLHDLGLRFLTPTVNLMMTQKDFLSFVLNMDDYLKAEFSFFSHPEFSCPCARLQPKGLPAVTVHFTHYKTAQEAEEKWRERAARIRRDNLFVFLEERDGIDRVDLEKLKGLQVRGVMAFTCNDYPDLPYCVYLEKYHAAGAVGNILEKRLSDDSREYEHFFDFVKWFNEAEGGSYDVRPFVKKAAE
jgi:uncharacterized protein (DUF1919 family)